MKKIYSDRGQPICRGLARLGGLVPMRSSRSGFIRRGGFTLIELLVVVAIILILLRILLPAVDGLRQNAQTAQCASNMRQLGIAFAMYINDWKVYPGAAYNASDKNGKPLSNGASDWVGVGSPLLCGPTNSALGRYVNRADRPCEKTIFMCPLENRVSNPWTSVSLSYRMNAYPGVDSAGDAIAAKLSFLPSSAVVNPAAKYLLLEENDSSTCYSENDDGAMWPPVMTGGGWPSGNAHAADRHSDGSNALFCDGHVKWSLSGACVPSFGTIPPLSPRGTLHYDMYAGLKNGSGIYPGFDTTTATAPGATTEQ